jgi:hypothetical protein
VPPVVTRHRLLGHRDGEVPIDLEDDFGHGNSS